jgi:hypothetical protein
MEDQEKVIENLRAQIKVLLRIFRSLSSLIKTMGGKEPTLMVGLTMEVEITQDKRMGIVEMGNIHCRRGRM